MEDEFEELTGHMVRIQASIED
uniref:Uncharacterized protein n=1 Tax=Rhizophora mucronata TaxID=61149 RepID=A0A2P2IZ30_RHIMU